MWGDKGGELRLERSGDLTGEGSEVGKVNKAGREICKSSYYNYDV